VDTKQRASQTLAAATEPDALGAALAANLEQFQMAPEFVKPTVRYYTKRPGYLGQFSSIITPLPGAMAPVRSSR
jgi:hypothetical protein